MRPRTFIIFAGRTAPFAVPCSQDVEVMREVQVPRVAHPALAAAFRQVVERQRPRTKRDSPCIMTSDARTTIQRGCLRRISAVEKCRKDAKCSTWRPVCRSAGRNCSRWLFARTSGRDSFNIKSVRASVARALQLSAYRCCGELRKSAISELRVCGERAALDSTDRHSTFSQYFVSTSFPEQRHRSSPHAIRLINSGRHDANAGNTRWVLL